MGAIVVDVVLVLAEVEVDVTAILDVDVDVDVDIDVDELVDMLLLLELLAQTAPFADTPNALLQFSGCPCCVISSP